MWNGVAASWSELMVRHDLSVEGILFRRVSRISRVDVPLEKGTFPFRNGSFTSL